MALFQISNDKITIQVDSMGAELKSLKDVATGREYMWNADFSGSFSAGGWFKGWCLQAGWQGISDGTARVCQGYGI